MSSKARIKTVDSQFNALHRHHCLTYAAARTKEPRCSALCIQGRKTVLRQACRYAALAAICTALIGCASNISSGQESPDKNRLTTGQVQLTLKKGDTTQTQVLESFGAPNLVTTNSDGEEIWTYQRNATVVNSSSSSAYGTVIFFGASTRSSGFEQSNRTMTLIIKFKEINGAKRVSSFDSRSSSF